MFWRRSLILVLTVVLFMFAGLMAFAGGTKEAEKPAAEKKDW